MKIREATMDDIEAILRMARSFVESSGTGFKFNPSTYLGVVDMLVTQENATLLLAEQDDGAIVGMIGGIVIPQLLDRSRIEGSEFFWWVDESARGTSAGVALLEHFEKWCKECGAVVVRMGALTGPLCDKVSALYEKRGYTLSEKHFSREI